MPRRTYNPKAGRSRPPAGLSADTLRWLAEQIRRQNHTDQES
jgi:hypothetical protein